MWRKASWQASATHPTLDHPPHVAGSHSAIGYLLGAARHEAPDVTSLAYIAALESMSRTTRLPDVVRGQMDAFLLKATGKEGKKELYEDAGILARILYLLM